MTPKETKPQTVGQLLAEARQSKGHSLRRAGAELGVSDKMVKQWEADFAHPEWERSATIADYCDVTRARVLYLMGVLSSSEADHLSRLDDVGSPRKRGRRLTDQTLPSDPQMGGYLAAAA